MQRPLLIAVLIAGMPSIAAAQTLKKCDDPKVPIGGLPTGNAVIWYRVGRDGKPDTAGMGVVQVLGMSVAGVRSVAVRLLSACRYDVKKDDSLSAGLLTELRFDTAHVALGSTNHADSPATLRTPETFSLPRDSVFPSGDRRVEEKPRPLKCPPAPRPPDFQASGPIRGATQGQAQAAFRADIGPQVDNWNRMNAGQLQAEFVVNPDGKLDGKIQVVQVTNPSATATLSEMINGCTWIPGRALGVAVPMRARMWVGRAALQRP
jgi:hypothetical protein